jgi:hypothetical protein
VEPGPVKLSMTSLLMMSSRAVCGTASRKGCGLARADWRRLCGRSQTWSTSAPSG